MRGVLFISFEPKEQELIQRASAQLCLLPRSPLLTESKAALITEVRKKDWSLPQSSVDLEALRSLLELLLIQLPEIILDLEHRKKIHHLIEDAICLVNTATGQIYANIL